MARKPKLSEQEQEILNYVRGYFYGSPRKSEKGEKAPKGLTTTEIADGVVENEDVTRRRLDKLADMGLLARTRFGKLYWELPRRRRKR